jgi:hypothetical protein
VKDSYKHGNEPLGSINCWKFVNWPAQEGLSFMELVGWLVGWLS